MEYFSFGKIIRPSELIPRGRLEKSLEEGIIKLLKLPYGREIQSK